MEAKAGFKLLYVAVELYLCVVIGGFGDGVKVGRCGKWRLVKVGGGKSR